MGGRRCRFRHAHPGATRGLCSLLGDLPPPPFSSSRLENCQKLHPSFRAARPYLYGIFKRAFLLQDGAQGEFGQSLWEGSPCRSKRERLEQFAETFTGRPAPAVVVAATNSFFEV